jgi:NAD binding domain of 6-phosphogluconate dehydrogenase
MVPVGTPTEETIEHLRPFLESGDTIIDGGNSFYKDDVRRSDSLKKQGIYYLDAGTSGGVWGIERGYCLMIGGDEGAVKRLEPIFEALAPGQGDIASSPGRENIQSTAEKWFLYCGPSGVGHFVKNDSQRDRIRRDAGLWNGSTFCEELGPTCCRMGIATISMQPILPSFGVVETSSVPGFLI